MKTLIVADDLTGALDSAVTFAGVGLRCTVARRPADIPAAMATAPDVLAVSTASREGSPEAATCAVSHVFDAIGDRPKLVFKKVDSRLKGHCAAELGMVAARTGIERAVVTPAIPAQGRATQGGQLSGAGVASPIDVAAIFAGAGVRDRGSRRGDRRRPRPRRHGCDVRGSGAPRRSRRSCGGACPASAPWRTARPGRSTCRRPCCWRSARVIPSRWHSLTPCAPPECRNCPPPTDGWKCRRAASAMTRCCFGSSPAAIRSTPSAPTPFLPQSASEFAKSVDVGTLLACGGETADAILGSLGVGILEVEGEALPGVPVSSMVVGGRRTRLVTKSGGFGAPDALARIVTMTADTGRD